MGNREWHFKVRDFIHLVNFECHSQKEIDNIGIDDFSAQPTELIEFCGIAVPFKTLAET